MPPRSSPHKLRVPILRKHTWCVTWADGDSAALHPIVVQCYAETYDGKSCTHCNPLLPHLQPYDKEDLGAQRCRFLGAKSSTVVRWSERDQHW
ncbi:hypothetical protein N7465_001287 [Penicillium sp. CMV-2018d]|nr:hypothetical protein N7465_001287 [Penicillium sp. CMV-2018d]